MSPKHTRTTAQITQLCEALHMDNVGELQAHIHKVQQTRNAANTCKILGPTHMKHARQGMHMQNTWPNTYETCTAGDAHGNDVNSIAQTTHMARYIDVTASLN